MRRITCLLLILLVMSGTMDLFAQVPEMINYQGRVAVNGTNHNGGADFKFSLVDSGVNSSWGATATAIVSGGWLTGITVTDGGTNYQSAPNVVITDSTGSGATAQSYISPAGVVTNIKVTAPGDGNYSASPTVTVDEPPEVMEYTTYWGNDGLLGEEPTSAVGLTVTKGLFSVKLGDTTLANMAALPATVFTNGELYLRVWFDHGEGPVQLTPDQRLVSVPYALKAAGVAAGSITESMLADGAISSNKLATGAVTTDALAVGAVTAVNVASGAIESNALAAGSVTIEKLYSSGEGPLSLITIPNSGPEQGDLFGCCVAEVGNGLIAVGERKDNATSNNSGRVHLYDADGTFVRTIANPNPIEGDEFGNSVAALGSDRMIIGAINKTLGTNYSCGAAYVYSIDGTLLVTITNPTPKVDDWFGESVASVGNDKILVGASHDDLGASGAGCAYLFDTNGTLLLTVTNPAPVGLDYYGNCVVGLDAQRFVVGAYWKDRGGPFPGEAYLYDVSGNLLVTITNPVPNSNDRFGWSLAIVDGDRILVGAPQDDTAGSDAGSVYLFDTNGTLLSSIANPVVTGSGRFGYAVASRGDSRFLAGAPNDDSAAFDAGRVYVLDVSGSLIATCESPFSAVAQRYGETVVMTDSGGCIAGCPSYDSPALSDVGVVYARTIGPVVPPEFSEMLADGSIPATKLDANYVRVEGDTMTGPLTIAVGGDVDLDVAGNAIIGPLTVSDGTGDGNSLTIAHGSGKAEIEYDYSPGILRLYVESTNPLVSMEYQQNVGIGVDNPDEKLDVGGNVRADSFLYSALRTNYAVVVADAFMPVSSAEGYAHGSGAYLTAVVTAEMTAPVQLPHGAVITRAQGFFYDNSAQNVAISLYALVLGTGNNVQLATMSSSGTPGYGSAADTSIVSPTVDNTLNGYYVHAEANPWDGPNLRVLGAVITYTLDETQ